ncbi:SGNH/GDSL hydrolase family protein [Pseudomonas sp.]|uniref:SGNH/GDSL hydrolase family protein n=1 Tax=Pseudomonas sp. TaxID=306 RepID=UPI003FD8646C
MQGKLFLSALVFSCAAMAEQSQLDQHVKCPASSDKAYRVLFVGDSITRHAFNKDTIRDLGWSHTSGMGASSAKTDYVNQLVSMIAKDRNQYVVKCYHTYGGSGSVADRVAGLPMVADTKPDLVVLQLGEHDDATTDPVLFHRQYATLVRQTRAMSSKPKVIAVGPWSLAPLNAKGEYTDSTAAVDREMYSVAIEETLEYLSVKDMAAIPEAHGWGKSEGVKWHPNDLGHAMYAARLFRLYKAVDSK